MKIFIFLSKIGLIKLDNRKVEKWTKFKEIDKLIFALQNGLYKVRIEAAKALGELHEKSAIPALRISLHDNVKTVAIASSTSLKKIGITEEIEKEVNGVIQKWTKKEIAAKTRVKHKEVYIANWKKTDWVAILKKQLQKPMRR